jgi:hypothetical protein
MKKYSVVAASVLMLGACTQQIVQPDPENTSFKQTHQTIQAGSHDPNGVGTRPGEALSPTQVMKSSQVEQTNNPVLPRAAEQMDSATAARQGSIEIDFQHSFIARLSIQALSLALEAAHAVGKPDVIRRATTFGREKLKKFASNDQMLTGFANKVKTLKMTRTPSPSGDIIKLEITSMDGKKFQAVADTRWERTCALIDRSFSATQKLTADVKNLQTGAITKMPHPFEGKSCSEVSLRGFRHYNFDLGTSS